jgi:hypothetical protein
MPEATLLKKLQILAHTCGNVPVRREPRRCWKHSGTRCNGTMRRMKLSDLQAQKRQMFIEMMQRGALKRMPRTRPRDAEEEQVLNRLAHLRWNRWLQNGTLVILAPRRWRLNLPPENE